MTRLSFPSPRQMPSHGSARPLMSNGIGSETSWARRAKGWHRHTSLPQAARKVGFTYVSILPVLGCTPGRDDD